MAKFSIIDATTGAVKYSGTPKYTGSYCKVSVLEFTEISSPTPIDWKVGDYVVYNGTGRPGLTYRLYDIPQPKKRAKNTLYGGAFVYSNVQFFPDTKLLEIEPFRDLVPADNDIHFTTQASWSVWTNAANLIDRFNAVMNTAYPGKWEFRLVDADAEETPDLYKLLYDTWFDFTISGENVLQGLTKLYDLCGNIGWVHSVELDDDDNPVNIITVGIPPIYTEGIGSITDIYRYGIGQGLTEIRKSTTNRNELKTRLFAYGSTRNMIPRHYNNLVPAIKDADSVYIPNLMLPLSKWGTTEVDGVEKKDASKAYIDNNVALYGLRPETVYFDGSNGQKEIYPSLEETTIGELYDVMASGATYRPNLSKHGRSVRLDEIEAVSGIVDDGQRSQAGQKYEYTEDFDIDSDSEEWPTGNVLMSHTIYEGEVSHTGTLDIDFTGFAPTLTDEGNTIVSISLRMLVSIGGRTYDTPISWSKQGSVYTGQIDRMTVKCSSGEHITLQIVDTIISNLESGEEIVLDVPASTLKAQYATTIGNEFVVRIPQIGFDISTRARLGSQGLATISMKDGKCGGRSFVVKAVKYNSTYDSWELTLYRGLDESLDILFPNTTYPIEAGNHFVLLDIAMPDTYIGMAELKLLSAATALLNDISVPKPFYEPLIDAKYMLDNGRTLLEGQYMRLVDSDITDGTEYVLIDTLVISEGESNIPTYKVTLREQKKVEYNNSQSSGSQLTSLASGANVAASSGGLTPAQKTLLANLDSWFGQDSDGNIFVKKDSEGNERNFYSFGEITAGGIGSDTPVATTTLGGLLNVVAEADNPQTTDKILVRMAGEGVTHWTLADLSSISGTVVGVKMNGVVKNPGTDKIVDLGTVLTEHQSLADYRTSANQDTIDDAIKGRLTTIEGLIPSAATTSNQLADKSFVNSSIATATATFRGTSASGLTEAQFLAWANGLTKDNNDYVFWNTTDSAGNVQFKRYKYNGSAWRYEYTLNNSSFTSAQWAAINSGLTSSDKTALDNALALIATYGNIVTHNVSEFATAAQGEKADTAYGWGDWRTRVGTLEGYFTDGSAKKALQLTTARNIWGQSFNGSADIIGDMSNVGKMTFTAKASASTSGNVLEVVNIGTSSNPVYALHTTLPFYSDSEITAGGIGQGGSTGGGLASLWALTSGSDVRLYDTETMVAKFGIKVNGNFITPSNGIFNISTSEGTVTQIKIGTTPYNPVSGVVSLPAYPTTLPASDVPSWAKSADLNAGINTLPVWTATPVDNCYFIRQDTGLTNTYGRVKFSALVTYIKGKLATVATSGAYSDLSGTPTALKNPYSLTFGSKTYDGSAAKTITASDLGALTSHQTVTLASGTNNGTLKITTNAGTVDNIAVKGLAALAFKASLVASDIPSLDWAKITTGKPTTISGYGITDAYTKTQIDAKTITVAGTALKFGDSISANTIVGAATSAATFAGTAAKATILATARSIWGHNFDGSAAISGDMSNVGKMTFTAKASASTSGNVLEVVTLNGVTYLHTTLPFFSDSEITAGGVGSGGGGGVNYLYMLEDVPDYRTSYRGKYLRAKSDGSGVEWVDVTGGVSSVISLTGDITQAQLRTALGLGSLAYINSLGWANLTNNANSLEEGTSDVTDNTELLTSYASNNGFSDPNAVGKVYKRDAIKVYNYVKNKLGLGSLAYLNGLSKSDVGLGNVENTALSTWTGTNKITTLGTITTGVWHGSAIEKSYLASGVQTSLGKADTAVQRAGDTITGSIVMNGSDTIAPFIRNFTATASTGWARRIVSLQVDGVEKFIIGAYGHYTAGAEDNDIDYAYIGCNGYNRLNLRINATELKWGTNAIYHEGNANLTSVDWKAKNLTLAGAISGATKIDFLGKATNEIGLEIKTVNGVRYLHTTLPFCSDSEITAGGVGEGGQGGGGLAAMYFNGVRADDGESAKFGIKVNGSWATILTDSEKGKYVDISTAAGSVTSITAGTGLAGGTITSSGTISINSTYQTYISHGETAYGYFSNGKLPASLVSGLATVATSGAYGDLSGKPTALKNPYSLTFGSKTYDGSSAKEIVKGDIGLGNVENKSSATIRGELTATNVTTALGYTPYNAANIGSASVNFANSADGIDRHGLSSEANIVEAGLRAYTGSGSTWTGAISSMAYAAIVTFGTPNRGYQLWARRGSGITGSLHFRVGNSGATDWEAERIIVDSENYTSYCATTTQGSHADTAYNWGNHANAGYLTTSAAAATYLPLSGGTMTDTLTISSGNDAKIILNNTDTETYWSFIRFQDHGTTYGELGTRGSTVLSWNGKTIYHSGNCNNTSTPWTCSNLTASGASYNGLVNHNTGHLYLNGADANSSSSNTTQIVFVANGDQQCSLTSNKNAFIINPTSGSTTNQIVLRLGAQSDFAGSIVATGEITAGSDSRWKSNQTPVLNGIDIIRQLRPMTWTWNEQFADKNYIGKQSAGLIAQQVASVLPFAVRGNEENGFTLDYNVFHAYEISAIQSHETRIQQLERENAELKRQLQQLNS